MTLALQILEWWLLLSAIASIELCLLRTRATDGRP